MPTKNLKHIFRETGKAGAHKRWGSARPASSTIRVHADVAAKLRAHCEANRLDTVAEVSRLIRIGIESKV